MRDLIHPANIRPDLEDDDLHCLSESLAHLHSRIYTLRRARARGLELPREFARRLEIEIADMGCLLNLLAAAPQLLPDLPVFAGALSVPALSRSP